MLRSTLLVLALCLTSGVAWTAREAVTADGERVLLNDDGTWQSLTKASAESSEQQARLTLERRQSLPTGCRFGLRLHNDLNAQIRSLVLRFTAYKEGPVAYETVTRGYSFIKPTNSQYQEIMFRGIQCDDIIQVQVHGADNCHVGELTKYSDG
ncbi:MAG: hypothetical protein RLZ44_1663, partial [Pseudomonadota bacterium]